MTAEHGTYPRFVASLDELLKQWWLLWSTADQAGRPCNSGAGETFADVGLFLEDPGQPQPWDYDATPAGALTFGSTGGDGEHFSIVASGDQHVVVMTVPMNFARPNFVLGEDLVEFLSLGSAVAFYRLCDVAYDPSQLLQNLQAPPLTADEVKLLAPLRAAFGLTRWSSAEARLGELSILADPAWQAS